MQDESIATLSKYWNFFFFFNMSRELTFDSLETSFCQSTRNPSGEASPYPQIKPGINPLIYWIGTLGSEVWVLGYVSEEGKTEDGD